MFLIDFHFSLLSLYFLITRLSFGVSEYQFSIFNAFEAEAAQKQFNVRYSCVTNAYERYLIGANKQIGVHDVSKDWQSCVYRWENIFRKEERDWKMVYLARIEDTNTAQIIWNFDFSASNLKIKDVQLTFNTMTYENGIVELQIFHKGMTCSKGQLMPLIKNSHLDRNSFFFKLARPTKCSF